MLALGEYEAGVHPTCGLHDSIAMTDPWFAWHDEVCPVCAEIDRLMRIRFHTEQKAESDLKPEIPRADDGRMSGIRLVPPPAVAPEPSTP